MIFVTFLLLSPDKNLMAQISETLTKQILYSSLQISSKPFIRGVNEYFIEFRQFTN